MVKLNRKNKNGSWTLSGAYLDYRKDGGKFSPGVWNQRQRDLRKRR